MWKIASVFWLLVGLGVNDARWREGDKEHADTNARVYIIVIDANGQNSVPVELDVIAVNDFERGDTNRFSLLRLGTFKDVCEIRIYHDNSGYSPGWYLRWVKVKRVMMKNYRKFIVNDWVPTQEEERNVNFVIQRTPPCSAGPLP
ncbi:lipoxygenase homology domain-containing protein 1-like isoform X4 [Pomacea canaliculata]|uniref:lipoxygenase homology domain-containing protein 1-like isoform X4 n=1 Tax=Pomacea canaliculata TaxID=400727 RepID=UPI000D73781E|nr:lipoxygenase homology domain-containing protein 1-like isoform X4 [Pomacea canaliculata]